MISNHMEVSWMLGHTLSLLRWTKACAAGFTHPTDFEDVQYVRWEPLAHNLEPQIHCLECVRRIPWVKQFLLRSIPAADMERLWRLSLWIHSVEAIGGPFTRAHRDVLGALLIQEAARFQVFCELTFPEPLSTLTQGHAFLALEEFFRLRDAKLSAEEVFFMASLVWRGQKL